jgi:hypothetical protein
MPTGPRGERRPADVIGGAIMVARLSVGEITEPLKEPSGKARSGRAGAAARAANLSQDRRTDIAKLAASKRWGGKNV